MKRIVKVLLFITISTGLAGQIGNLVWEDNFNDGSLNPASWNIETGTGVNGDWGTGQLDRATGRPQNLSFEQDVPGAEDGCLVITTRKEFYIDRQYTSGRINTAGKQSWGPGHRLEARVWPRDVRHKGQGFAFWTMPDEIPEGWNYIMWPQGGEVDIMEYVGSIPFNNLGGVHYAWFWENNQWQSWNHGHKAAYYNFETRQVPDPPEPGYGGYPVDPGTPFAGSSEFHTYGINWYTNRMEFFVDDNIYHIHYFIDGDGFIKDGQDDFAIKTVNNKRLALSEYSHHFDEWSPFDHRMYAILSAGVGGSNYTYGGPIVPEAEFPCAVFIDWIRVYELNTSAIEEKEEKASQILIYPNPASKRIFIKAQENESFRVDILDMNGKMILSSQYQYKEGIDISSLEKGRYIILFRKDDVLHSQLFAVN
jgi:hypothetical protein